MTQPTTEQERLVDRSTTAALICPRCGISLVTGKPAPNCVTDGREAHDVWCAEENYADDPCATCMGTSRRADDLRTV